MAPINRGFLTAGILTVIGTGIVAFTYVGNDNDQRGLRRCSSRSSPVWFWRRSSAV